MADFDRDTRAGLSEWNLSQDPLPSIAGHDRGFFVINPMKEGVLTTEDGQHLGG